jgi:hypothetical protein
MSGMHLSLIAQLHHKFVDLPYLQDMVTVEWMEPDAK